MWQGTGCNLGSMCTLFSPWSVLKRKMSDHASNPDGDALLWLSFLYLFLEHFWLKFAFQLIKLRINFILFNYILHLALITSIIPVFFYWTSCSLVSCFTREWMRRTNEQSQFVAFFFFYQHATLMQHNTVQHFLWNSKMWIIVQFWVNLFFWHFPI